jgi:hypothetical protein
MTKKMIFILEDEGDDGPIRFVMEIPKSSRKETLFETMEENLALLKDTYNEFEERREQRIRESSRNA